MPAQLLSLPVSVKYWQLSIPGLAILGQLRAMSATERREMKACKLNIF